MDAKELWQHACELMKPQMNILQYTTWIETAKPVALQGNTLYVTTGSDLHYDMVTKQHQSAISDALCTAAGTKVIFHPMKKDEGEKVLKALEAGEHIASYSPLNEKYTFNTFVVGSNNSFAHAACVAVASNPGSNYNPLFIYGGAGLGKTHLMHAIGHYVQEVDPTMRVEYVTTEKFTNELIDAIQNHRTAEFRENYRKVDLLLIDDIQFLARAERTQEEFFHTFNALRDAGKQIVISSDKAPKDIPKLEERLSSRFEWGLVADVQRPDLETRVAILQRKAHDELMQIDDDVIMLIAERMDSNIRELEGCLTRLDAYARLTGKPIDVNLAQEALREVFQRAKPRQLDCDTIINVVADYFSLTEEDIKGPRRSRELAVPRQIAMFLCRDLANISFPRIGEAFHRDHSTVLHGVEKVDEELKKDVTLASQVDDLRRRLKER